MNFYKKILALFAKLKSKKKILLNSGKALSTDKHVFYENIKLDTIRKNNVILIYNKLTNKVLL